MKREVLSPIGIAIVMIAALFSYETIVSQVEGPLLASNTAHQPSVAISTPTQTPTSTQLFATTVIKEADFTPPYPILWQGGNRETISLTKAVYGETQFSKNIGPIPYDGAQPLYTGIPGNSRGTVTLYFQIHTADGGFCMASLSNDLRWAIDEYGDTFPPILLDNNCIGANLTLADQKVLFPISMSAAEGGPSNITLQVFDRSGNPRTFFMIKPFAAGSILDVEPAPGSG